ncbi:MAG: hypothetical protein PHG63_02970, partial [Candidatus Dojkabacteria bacterium]|nr:hypothetical protein [Candidatus Dojkabacteria bacterium]
MSEIQPVVSWYPAVEYVLKNVIQEDPVITSSPLTNTAWSGSDVVIVLPRESVRFVDIQIPQREAGAEPLTFCIQTFLEHEHCVQSWPTVSSVENGEFPYSAKYLIEMPELLRMDRIIAGLMAILGGSISMFLFRFTDVWHAIMKRITCVRKIRLFRNLNRVGELISEEHLIRFDARVIAILLVSSVIFIVSVIALLHTSSAPIWNRYLPVPAPEDGVLLGSPKSIRSDEWRVNATNSFSQAEMGFPESNSNIGAGQTPLVSNLPVSHITTLFRPQMWGYFLFGAERGYVFQWNFSAVSLFVGAFLVLLILTRNNFYLSLAGAIWFFLSSYVQWWFSSVAGMTGIFFFLTVSVHYLLFSERKLHIAIAGVLSALFAVNFFLFLYPPFQISLGYLLLALVVVGIFQNRNHLFNRSILVTRSVTFFLMLISTGIITAVFLRDTWETIHLAANTVYPGSRGSVGGSLSLSQLLRGYLTFPVQQNFFPARFGNVSEASGFIFLSPLLCLAYMAAVIRKWIPRDPRVFALVLVVVLLGAWAIMGMPQIVSTATLFSRIPESRVMLALGVGDLFLSAMMIAALGRISHTEKLRSKLNLAFALVVSIGILALGVSMVRLETNYITFMIVGLITLTFFILTTALQQKRYGVVIACASLLVLPSISINPVSRGLNVFEDERIDEIVEYSGDGTWAFFGDNAYASLLKAYGADVFNGVKIVPDLESMQIIDPGSNYVEIYNRYAHISLQTPPSDHEAELFTLNFPDSYTITIDPC